MINNRQNGRRRGRGGSNNGGGGNNNPRQGQGRGDSGNRIDSRARGNAAQLLEKYRNMASDAQRQGDRVNTEYYLQFADHYFRVLADQRGRFEDQQPQQHRQRNDVDLDGEDDYGDEGEPIRAGEQQGDGGDGRGFDTPRNEGRQGDGRPAGRGEYEPGQNRQGQADGGRWEQRDDRSGRGTRLDRNGPNRDAQQTEVAGQHRSDPPVAGEEPGDRAEQLLVADAPLPRRRGRPRRDAATAVAAPVGAEVASDAASVDADRLPPSLGISAVAANDSTGNEPKPRRRRTPRAGGESAPAAE